VGGVAASVYPSVEGVGVASLDTAAAAANCTVPPGGFLDILDLVSRTGTGDGWSGALTTGLAGL